MVQWARWRCPNRGDRHLKLRHSRELSWRDCRLSIPASGRHGYDGGGCATRRIHHGVYTGHPIGCCRCPFLPVRQHLLHRFLHLLPGVPTSTHRNTNILLDRIQRRHPIATAWVPPSKRRRRNTAYMSRRGLQHVLRRCCGSCGRGSWCRGYRRGRCRCSRDGRGRYNWYGADSRGSNNCASG